jgi:hypothetical protein
VHLVGFICEIVEANVWTYNLELARSADNSVLRGMHDFECWPNSSR